MKMSRKILIVTRNDWLRNEFISHRLEMTLITDKLIENRPKWIYFYT